MIWDAFDKNNKTNLSNSWEDVPQDIKATFDTLGIPEAEKKSLSGVGAQYIVYAPDWCKAIDEFTIAPRVVDIRDGAHVGASKLEGRMVYADAVTDKKAVIAKITNVISL